MVLGIVIAAVVIVMIAYGSWMAGELGVGSRWRRSRRDAGVEADSAARE